MGCRTGGFDSLNPGMDKKPQGSGQALTDANKKTFTTYAARLISPLESRQVSPSALEIDVARFKEKTGPATGVVEVDGSIWRFKQLPASLAAGCILIPSATGWAFRAM